MKDSLYGNPKAKRTATLIALALATSAENWTTSGVSLTLTDLTGTLSASSDEASWALTVYTTAFAIGVALSHHLSLNFGNRRYLTACASLYAVASCGCALSPDLQTFLFFRAIAGFAGGAFLVRSFVFFTQKYPIRERAIALVMYGITFFAIGKLLSPIVSGWFADTISWRYLFSISMFLSVIAAILFARNTEEHWLEGERKGKSDIIGALLLITGAGCLQTVLSRGEIDGWFESPTLIVFFVAGILGNLFFILWELSPWNSDPLVDVAFLRDRSSLAGAVLGFAVGILLAGSLYVIPQYLRSLEAHSAFQTGLLLSIGGASAVLVLCGFGAVSVLITRLGGGGVLVIALLVEMTSQLLFAHYLTPDTPDRFLWLPLALNGVFIALSVPTLGIVAFAQINDIQSSNARALYYGCRQLGASVGVTCAAVLIDRRMSLHSSRLLDAFAGRDSSILGASPAMLSSQALAGAVRRQSTVLSYTDVFLGMTLIAAVTLLFVPLLPSPPSQEPLPGAEPKSPRPVDADRLRTIGATK
jgi:EmrB/QacA subfamily drug resistance transporter